MSPRRSTRSTPQKPQSLASKGKTRSNTARRRETYLDLDSEGEPTSSEDEAEEPRSKRAKRRHEQPVTPNKKNTRLNGIAPPTPELTPNRKHKGANGRKAPPVHVVQLPPTPTKTPTKPTKRRRPITEPTQETSLLDAPVEVEPASTETYRQSPQPEATPALPAARNTTSGQIVTSPGRVYSTESLRLLQSSILSKLRGYQPLISDTDKSPFLPCLESYEKDVRSSLERTVTEDEGNCTLLIGPRGVGKSTVSLTYYLTALGCPNLLLCQMVQHIIEGLREKHGADGFLLVKLNGLVHSTDRLALRDIARQLCASHLLQDGGAAVDDDGASFTSHASTLASLLAILEPPSGSTSATTSSKAIIFVLDEFDLFALRDARQSFLYCLLDIVQSHRRTGGMAVLGLSSRIDSLNMLEKRLKSRCQSRVLHVLSESVWTDIAKTGLRVGVDAILHQADVRDIDDVEDLPQLAADWNRSGVDVSYPARDV